MSRPSRPALVGNMAPIPQKIHTRFIVQSAIRQTLGSWTQSNLHNWPAYYDPSSQMLCVEVSPLATTATDTTASWLYHPAQITHTRRFLAVSKSNTFADARPEIDAVPVTVLRDIPSLFRFPLPPISNTSALYTLRSHTRTTFYGSAFTLPTLEQTLTHHATLKPSHLTS